LTAAAGPAGDLAARLAAVAGSVPGATVVAGAIAGPAEEVVCRARRGARASRHTVFEIGSVSKAFTALLLADAHVRGEVRLRDAAVRHLPPPARPRHAAAGRISLLHLATHTAGLPRLPANLYPVALPRLLTAPYAAYGPELLYRATARLRPRPAPGLRVRYSNLGVGLVGHLLARAAGRPYPCLLAERVCGPLGLDDTSAVPEPPGRADPARPAPGPGHRRRDRPVPPMACHGLTAAGGVRSSADDLLRFLRAHLDPGGAPAPLGAALREVLLPRLTLPDGSGLALVWNVRVRSGRAVYFQSGANSGFTAFAGFCPAAGAGVVALADTTWSRRQRLIPAAYALLAALAGE
jgi:CubicO group peptidase (beta-lactamase class C family)